VVDGVTNLAPFTLTNVPAGSVHTFSTLPVQDTNGVRYVWTNWSDGGLLTHLFTTPGSNTTITAKFAPLLSEGVALVVNGGGKVSPNLDARPVQPGQTVILTAQPTNGFLFAGWTGSITSSAPTLTFTAQAGQVIEANFISNPFLPAKGSYAGLFFPTNDAAFQSSGFLTATLSGLGAFSSRIQLAGSSFSFSGQFTTNGLFSNSIPRNGLPALSVSLQLDVNGGNVITGQISDGTFAAELVANRNVFSRYNPAPQSANRYTLAIPGSDNSPAQPGGDGFGTVTVNYGGSLRFGGTLGDGTAVSQATFVSAQGQWPLYVPLYSHGGAIFGVLTFTNQPTTDLSGLVNWFKPNQPRSKLYPTQFAIQTNVVGSIYTFINGLPVLNLNPVIIESPLPVPDFAIGHGQIILENGGLPSNFTNQFTLGLRNQTTNEPPNRLNDVSKLSLSFSLSSGVFQGRITDLATRKATSFRGAVLQKTNIGAGYFLNTNQSGRVRIEAQ
jgi:hypothetical protein